MSNFNTYKIKVQENNSFCPKEDDIVSVSYQGDKYAVVKCIKREVKTHTRRIDKDTYEVIATGEKKKYDRSDKKKQELSRRAVLRRTFERLKGLIRTNFVSEGQEGENSQAFLTLTYAENMKDPQRLYEDFKKFMKRLNYFSSKKYEYICVAEPQGRGAWHVHVMLKTSDGSSLWIPREKLTELWGLGRTNIKRLRSNDVGAYYTAYFTCMLPGCNDNGSEKVTGKSVFEAEIALEEATRVLNQKQGEKTSKSIPKSKIKADRLRMYPKGMRIYRCSRGIKKVITKKVQKSELKKRGYEKVREGSVSINKVNEKGEVTLLNEIYKGTYKKTNLERRFSSLNAVLKCKNGVRSASQGELGVERE